LRFAYLSVLLFFCLHGSRANALDAISMGHGVYAFVGANAEASPANNGFVGNSGFIVGATGVVVIDTGASYAHGKAMLAAIEQITRKPVEVVILTHAVQDFVFGAAAFAERGIPMLAHRKTLDLMRARCEHCLENLRKVLGEDAMARTRLVLPQQVLERGSTSPIAGRSIDLIYLDWASTPGDLAVLDRPSGILFAGGIVTAGRVPELRDGDYAGWLKALSTLGQMNITQIVPGYGPPQPRGVFKQMADYLAALDGKIRFLYDSGRGLMQAVDESDLGEYSTWALYPEQHRRNALRRYLQMEIEDLEK
jgi:glyoxylase-like metal-dependent hydrolase (beta-lactamase superfamily II)